MRQLAFLIFICFAFFQVTAFADVAGEITFASGEVRIGKSNGKSVDIGTKINEGEALETGADGHLHIKFIDGGILILRPSTTSVVENYSLNSADPSQSRMRIMVLHGTVRSITGAGAKAAPRQFRLNTPVAALGVRGTDFMVYTDQQTTRALVTSGGIVMALLGDTCSALGVGPCEGQRSTELFAGNSQLMLQVSAGGIKPEIINRHDPALQPDAPTKASPDSSGDSASKPTAQIYATSIESRAADAVVRGIESRLPETAEPSRIKWGRWEKLLEPNNTEEIGENWTRTAANAKFALFRENPSSFTMPHEGNVSFRLANQESFFFNASLNQSTPAIIENAKFSVDFAARTFATDFTMRAENLSTEIKAKGGLFPDGRFVSNVVSSNASVRGVLAGPGASQAGFLFHRPVTPNVTAYGATSWVR